MFLANSVLISSPKSDLTYLQEDFNNPTGVAVDSKGFIVFTDFVNGNILKFDSVSKKIVTIAGGGKAGFKDGIGQSANFNNPQGITIVCSGKNPEFPDNLTPTDIQNLVVLCWSQEAMARPSFTDIVTKLNDL